MKAYFILAAVFLSATASERALSQDASSGGATVTTQTTGSVQDGFIVVDGTIYVVHQGLATVLPESLRLGGTPQGINGFTQLIAVLKPGYLLTFDGKVAPAPTSISFGVNPSASATPVGTTSNGTTSNGTTSNGTTSNGTTSSGTTINGSGPTVPNTAGTNPSGTSLNGNNRTGTNTIGTNSTGTAINGNGRTGTNTIGTNANGTSINGTGSTGTNTIGTNANGTGINTPPAKAAAPIVPPANKH